MSKEISLGYTPSVNLYAVIKTAVGQYVNGTTPEAFNSAHWTNYAITLTEYASATGQYYADFPAIPTGVYCVEVYLRAGSSPALSDGPPIAVGKIQWTGTAEAILSTYAGGAVASVTGAVGSVTGNVSGNVVGSVASVTAPVIVNAVNGLSPPANWPLMAIDGAGHVTLVQAFPANFAALGISGAGKINEVVLTDTVTTYTGNTPQTGDAFAQLLPAFAIVGHISSVPSPSATLFAVTLNLPLDSGKVAADLIGLYCTMTSGARFPVPAKIDGATLNSSTSVTLSFATGTLSEAPSTNDTVLISG